MNKTARTTPAMDGFDVWYFGNTPEPDDHLTPSAPPSSIDQDDSRLASFSHRCHCGEPAHAGRQGAMPGLLALHC